MDTSHRHNVAHPHTVIDIMLLTHTHTDRVIDIMLLTHTHIRTESDKV